MPSNENQQDRVKYTLGEVAALTRDMQKDIESINKEHISTLLKSFLKFKLYKEDLEAELDTAKAFYDMLNSEIVPNALQSLGLDSVRIGDRTYTLTGKMHASVPNSNMKAAKEWLSQRQMGHLVKESINSKTLTAALTEHFELKGETPPSDVITTYTKKAISVRKNV